jgi:SAM-dependent methyltransferase
VCSSDLLNLARIAANPAPLWLLDEPAVGLDTASVASLTNLIAAHRAQGGIAIVSTHTDLGIDDAATRLQANLFLGAPARVTRYMLRSLHIDYNDFVFVDYGSGKGRTLLVAAEFPFKKIIGVEISQELHAIANMNLDKFRGKDRKCADIELFCGDARGFALPDSDLVLYMYHPFGQDILREVLQHIVASTRENPSRILIPYLFPVAMAKAVFKEFPQFTKVRDVWCVNTQYRWTLYEYHGQ